jgi:hypothetical protein
MASRPKLLLSARRLQKEGQKTQKLSWVWVPVKMSSVPWKLTIVEEWWTLFVLVRRLQEQRSQTRKECPGFESWWRCFLYLGN